MNNFFAALRQVRLFLERVGMGRHAQTVTDAAVLIVAQDYDEEIRQEVTRCITAQYAADHF